jgi:formylglycine-generating enzyme required for sulfatase activity
MTAPSTGTSDMAWIPGGTFRMGSNDFYPEERPVHEVTVDGFWMDDHPVTVAEFRRFVKATGHVTVAEQPLEPSDYPGADPTLLVPGSLVFQRTLGPVNLNDYSNWWHWVPGAQWRHPEGPRSTLDGRERHPVTHVAYADVVAYAAWAGKELPTEAEWEFAARGGLDGSTYAWGNEFAPKGRQMANTWQGEFPWQNLMLDKYERTSPVKSFPPNGYGLYDVAGNVWEWTTDYYTPAHPDEPVHACCGPGGPRLNPRVTSPDASYNVGGPGEQFPRMVVKGGSHLCAPNYCHRYRPAARSPQSVETSMGHLGFRCIVRPATAG